jgi:ERCC4-related helicase
MGPFTLRVSDFSNFTTIWEKLVSDQKLFFQNIVCVCRVITKNLQQSSIEDKDQTSCMEVIQKFKLGIYHVLVATDVASRGLDIKNKYVVNFEIVKYIISIRSVHSKSWVEYFKARSTTQISCSEFSKMCRIYVTSFAIFY